MCQRVTFFSDCLLADWVIIAIFVSELSPLRPRNGLICPLRANPFLMLLGRFLSFFIPIKYYRTQLLECRATENCIERVEKEYVL